MQFVHPGKIHINNDLINKNNNMKWQTLYKYHAPYTCRKPEKIAV